MEQSTTMLSGTQYAEDNHSSKILPRRQEDGFHTSSWKLAGVSVAMLYSEPNGRLRHQLTVNKLQHGKGKSLIKINYIILFEKKIN